MSKYSYGWRPNLININSPKYSEVVGLADAPLPRVVDLRPHCPPVYDQGNLGSCTANALAGQYEYVMNAEGMKGTTPSRLFIYYNERVREKTTSLDVGASLGTGITSLTQEGAPPESLWPYDITKFAKQPTPQAYITGAQHTIYNYVWFDNRDIWHLKHCLSLGYPFVFGFTVYESFESDAVAHSAMVPMPGPTEKILGGHAVMVVGYTDDAQKFIVRNSWGDRWGDKGYFYMPYQYVVSQRLCDDFWVFINTK